MFDWQQERPGAEGQSDEGLNRVTERRRNPSDGWVTVTATRVHEVGLEPLEPLDYDLDIFSEVRRSPEHLTQRGVHILSPDAARVCPHRF